jgi:hypothetical protein
MAALGFSDRKSALRNSQVELRRFGSSWEKNLAAAHKQLSISNIGGAEAEVRHLLGA